MSREKLEKVIVNLLNDERFAERYMNEFESIVEEFELSGSDVAFLKDSLDSCMVEELTIGMLSTSSYYGCFGAYDL